MALAVGPTTVSMSTNDEKCYFAGIGTVYMHWW